MIFRNKRTYFITKKTDITWSVQVFVLVLFFAFSSKGVNAQIEQHQRDIDSCKHYLQLAKSKRGIDLFEAEEHCKRALEFALLSNNDKLLARVYLQLGYFIQMNHKSQENVEYFFESLKIADRLNDDTLRAKIYNNIGGSYFVYGKSKKALEYFHKSLPLVQKLDIKPMLAVQFNNIGLIYSDLHSYDSANVYYNRAVGINTFLNNKDALVFNYGNIGFAYKEREMYDSSFFFYTKQKEIATEINDKVSLTDSYTALSEYFLINKNYEKSIAYADSCFLVGKESGYTTAFTEPMQIRAEALSRLGRFEESLAQFKEQKLYIDSLQDKRLKDLNSNIELKYNYEQQRKQMELELQDEKLEGKSRTIKITLLISLLVCIPLIVFVIIFYLRYKEGIRIIQNQKLEEETINLRQEAESKSKNLTTSILHEISKNDIVNRSLEKLKKNIPNFTTENQSIILDIIEQLQNRINKNIWNEFKVNFEKVHVNFYKNLLQKHPDLTPNEKRLSAFIRLNISSKDISSLTGQNVHSIEVARTRLRKKLNLANTNINLVTFMEQF